MTLPRDLSGQELVNLLARYEYHVTRQNGSHMRLTSTLHDRSHHITIPNHKNLRIGTLHSILYEVATYLKLSIQDLQKDLFD